MLAFIPGIIITQMGDISVGLTWNFSFDGSQLILYVAMLKRNRKKPTSSEGFLNTHCLNRKEENY
jgi:hypothetical protein